MTDTSPEHDLNALKADIERLRGEIAGLAAGLKAASGNDREASAGGGAASGAQKSADRGEHDDGEWADLLSKLNASRVEGEKMVKEFVSGVEQHPLLGVMAAFGLGFIIAKLWDRGSKP